MSQVIPRCMLKSREKDNKIYVLILNDNLRQLFSRQKLE